MLKQLCARARWIIRRFQYFVRWIVIKAYFMCVNALDRVNRKIKSDKSEGTVTVTSEFLAKGLIPTFPIYWKRIRRRRRSSKKNQQMYFRKPIKIDRIDCFPLFGTNTLEEEKKRTLSEWESLWMALKMKIITTATTKTEEI